MQSSAPPPPALMPLPKPRPVRVYLVAGESSGDALGAALMRALRQEAEGFTGALAGRGIAFAGIGGPLMEAEGLDSLFPLRELAVMGFVEVLPHARRLLRRIEDAADHLAAYAPDVVVTIDAPGFNVRMARRLRRIAGQRTPPLVHYVAPTVWAYRPGRARTFASVFSHLLALFPFEPPYFTAAGLPCTSVGHPVIEQRQTVTEADIAAFAAAHGLAGDAVPVLMLPGSRKGELVRHLPLFAEVAQKLRAGHPALTVILPVPADLARGVQAQVVDWPVPVIVVADAREKAAAFALCRAALSKSGTVTLELALAGLPMVVTHRVHPWSAWLMRRLIRIPYVCLVNILLQRPVVPELLQEQATPARLHAAMDRLLRHPGEARQQRVAFAEVWRQLGGNDPHPPSRRAAHAVLQVAFPPAG